MSEDPGRLIAVALPQFPVDLQERAQAHVDGLLREFRLMREQAREHPEDVPARLLQLMADLSERYGGVSEEQDVQLEAARAAGQDVLAVLRFQVPALVADACRTLSGVLDAVDDYCRCGQHLLMLATPPELVAYRRWYLDEVARQVEGAPPTSWPAYRDLHAPASGSLVGEGE